MTKISKYSPCSLGAYRLLCKANLASNYERNRNNVLLRIEEKAFKTERMAGHIPGELKSG